MVGVTNHEVASMAREVWPAALLLALAIAPAHVNAGGPKGGGAPGLAAKEGLPPGLQKHVADDGQLPPGLQRHLDRFGELPPGLQKRLAQNGKGGGKAVADVSYHCLGAEADRSDRRAGSSYIENTVVLEVGSEEIVLDAVAAGDLADEYGAILPVQGASAVVESNGLTLHPFDLCATSAESVLDAIVVGNSVREPQTVGIADVEFVLKYAAIFEIADAGHDSTFAAYTETSLQVLGIEHDAFEVLATNGHVEAPPGLRVSDVSQNGVRRYEISGKRVVDGRLYYGPGITNVVKTTFLAGTEAASFNRKRSKIVAGFAAADALDSLSYEIVSLDPDVEFYFADPTAGDASAN
jgi:hypothetical protein